MKKIHVETINQHKVQDYIFDHFDEKAPVTIEINDNNSLRIYDNTGNTAVFEKTMDGVIIHD